jgi:cytoskeletal protein CcmA (bactofilin family)
VENIITEIEEASIPRGGHRNGAASAKAAVTLGPRDILNGSLTVDGDLHIEGTAEGEINASGDVDIEASATVRARVDGRNITVRGNVTGNVTARARLSVAGSGVIAGDVRAVRLRVDDGGTVNGSITMGATEQE